MTVLRVLTNFTCFLCRGGGWTVLAIMCGEEGVECFVSFDSFEGMLFSDNFKSFERGCFGCLDSFDS